MLVFKRADPPIKYKEIFKPGDVAVSKHYVRFCDKTEHLEGQRIIVTEENKHYYNIMHEDYHREAGPCQYQSQLET